MGQVIETLEGHVSPETAYLVHDYPYGFKLRCAIRYWIETNPRHGQRFVSQTTNPKLPYERWNAPKPSTYSTIRVMFLDEERHVKCDGLHVGASVERVEDFVARYPHAFEQPSYDGSTFLRDEAIAWRATVLPEMRRAAEIFRARYGGSSR